MWCTVPAPGIPRSLRGVIAPVEVALLALQAVPALTLVGEPERLGQQLTVGLQPAGDVGAGAFDAEDRVLGRDFGMLGAQRRIAVLGDHELQTEPVVVGEGQ